MPCLLENCHVAVERIDRLKRRGSCSHVQKLTCVKENYHVSRKGLPCYNKQKCYGTTNKIASLLYHPTTGQFAMLHREVAIDYLRNEHTYIVGGSHSSRGRSSGRCKRGNICVVPCGGCMGGNGVPIGITICHRFKIHTWK